MRKFLDINWKCMWLNLHACAALDAIKLTWYMAIHGLIPTNERLAAINLTATGACSSCKHDSLQHRMTGCREGPIIWTWTKNVLGVILRMDHRYIPQDSTLRPAMQHWPAQKQPTILWILARLIHYRLQTHCHLSFLDWTFYGEPDGSYIAKPKGLSLQAVIWMSSTGHNPEMTLFQLPPPLCAVLDSPPVTYRLCSMNTVASACYTALCCDTDIPV
jgi:hypothetical protein